MLKGLIKKSFIILFLLMPATVLLAQNKQTGTKKQRPNILFCIADDASMEYMSAYGFNNAWIKTPAFDRVAREGVLFNNAYTPNAKCAPSRACILTGRNSWQLEAAGNHSPIFRGQVYHFYGGIREKWIPDRIYRQRLVSRRPGPDRWQAQNAYRTRLQRHQDCNAYAGISPVDYASNFERFLQTKSKDQPFCFWVGTHEPHRAYQYGSGVAKGNKKLSDITSVPPYWIDNDTVRNDMLDYAYEVEYFDSHLARIIDILDKNGELDNTVIVVTADNGMPFPR